LPFYFATVPTVACRGPTRYLNDREERWLVAFLLHERSRHTAVLIPRAGSIMRDPEINGIHHRSSPLPTIGTLLLQADAGPRQPTAHVRAVPVCNSSLATNQMNTRTSFH